MQKSEYNNNVCTINTNELNQYKHVNCCNNKNPLIYRIAGHYLWGGFHNCWGRENVIHEIMTVRTDPKFISVSVKSHNIL